MEIPVEYRGEIDRICKQIAELYKRQLEEDNAVASGALLRSVDNYTTNINGDTFELWFNLEHYWKYAPEDVWRGNKIPPVSSIKKWIEDKHLDLNEWAVATNIKKYGWRNQPRQNFEQFINSFDFDILENELEGVLFNALEQKTLREITEELLKGL